MAAGVFVLAATLLMGTRVRIQKQRAQSALRHAEEAETQAQQALEAAAHAREQATSKDAEIIKQSDATKTAQTILAETKAQLESLKAEASRRQQQLERNALSASQSAEAAMAEMTSSEAAARSTIARLQFTLAEQAFNTDDAARGIAILADMIRLDPGNAVAAARLVSALTDRSFALPVHPPLPVAPNSEVMALSDDGTKLATIARSSTQRNTVSIWRIDGQSTKAVVLTHSNRVEHLAFNRDGTRLAVSINRTKAIDQDGRTALLPKGGETWIWETDSGERIAGPLKHDVGVWTAEFNEAGNRILTLGGDKTLRVWDAKTGSPAARPMQHAAPASRAFFSPDGSLVATVSGRTVFTWNAQTGDGPVATLQHAGNVLDAEFTIDSKLLVVFPSDDKAVVWDSRSGEPKLTAPFPLPNIAPAAGARISPDGQRIAAAHRSGGAAIWDAFSGQSVTDIPRHTLPVTRVEFSPNGRLLATAAIDRTARLWDAHEGFPLSEPINNLAWPHRLQFFPRGDRLVLMQGETGAEIRTTLPGAARPLMLFNANPVVAARYSADGSKIIATNSNDVRLVWDARNGRRASLPASSVTEDRFTAAVTGRTIVVENNRTKNTVKIDLSGALTSALHSAIVSRDGSRVMTITDGEVSDVKASLAGGAVQAFDAKSGAPLTPRLAHPFPIASASFSPDATSIATACFERDVRIFNVTRDEKPPLLLPHLDPVIKVWFSPDGSRLLTLSEENDLRVWDAASGQPVSETKQQRSKIEHLQFNRTGDQLLILSETGFIELWNIPTPPTPAPEWLPELANAVVGVARDNIHPGRNTGILFQLRNHFNSSPKREFYDRWGAWFLGDRTSRAISPFSDLNTQEFLKTLINENSFDSILQAVSLAPTNAKALARLALLTLDEPAGENIRRIGEADFYSLLALQLNPRDSEVIRVREIVSQSQSN